MQDNIPKQYEKTVDIKFFLYVLFTFLVLYFQFISPINYLLSISIFFFVVISFYKRWVSGLIPILSLSFLHGENSVSIYTYKLGGVSLFYLLILFVFLLKLLTRRSISKIEIYFVLYIFCCFMISIINGNFEYLNYFLNDSVFLSIGFIFLFIIIDNKNIPYDKIFLSISSGYFITKLIMLYTGVGVQVIPYSEFVNQYSVIFDPIENFLLIYNLQTIIFPKYNSHRYCALINFSLFILASYFLGYMNGATIMLVIFVLIYNMMRRVKSFIYIVVIVLCFTFFLVTVGLTLNTGEESVFLYKVEKIMGLFQFLYDSDVSIYDLPRSTQVRLIETGNLLYQNFVSLFFGNGFGGYVEENHYFYGNYLNQDDYTLDQINSGRFQVLHAYNQIVLKHGLLALLIALFIFYRFRNLPYRNFRDTSLIFVVFSYSFTIKPYLILAFLILSLTNKREVEIEKK